MGSKKYPRFGYYATAKETSRPIEPTDEIIGKWARQCLKEHDGHRRALMLSTQAAALAKLTCATLPQVTDELVDPWLKEQGLTSHTKAAEVPDMHTQVKQRLKKLVYISKLAKEKHVYRGKLTKMSLEMMNRMEDQASKNLKGQPLRDYTNQERPCSSPLALR